MNIKKGIIKKHVYLFVSSVVLFTCLFIAGYIATRSFSVIANANQWVTDYTFVLDGWRLLMYTIIFVLWKPFVIYQAQRKGVNVDHYKVGTLVAYRYKVLVAMAVYEIFIARNIIGFMIEV